MQGLKVPVTLTLQDKLTSKLNGTFNKLDTMTTRISKGTNMWSTNIKKAAEATKQLQSEFKKNNTLVDEFSRKLKGVFSAYAGVMTIRAVVQASDVITGAENRLNYANGGDKAATEASMDKMYAASLRARTDYGAMMSNVGKSMALAGDKAFQGNIDNAIKFQETMAKAYAIGGASAAEQHSSMYQMVQALGSGILQGDELRSVREGAPLAYKEIEKFAQKTLQTEESLKDLASQGKITSEMVVAAMMEASDGIDKAFKNTDMTIAQAFTNMKTVAMDAFRPIQDTINEFMKTDQAVKLFNGLAIAIQWTMDKLNLLISMFLNSVSWIVDNWYWVQWIVYAVAVAIIYLSAVAIGQWLWKAVVTIASSAWTAWFPWLFVGALVIASIYMIAQASENTVDFIVNLLLWVAKIALGVFALIVIYAMVTGAGIAFAMNFVWLFWVALIAAVIALLIGFADKVGAVVGAIVAYVINMFVGLINGMIQIFYSMFVEPIAGLVEWIVNAFTGGFDNIGGAFVNLLGQMLSILVGFAKPAAKLIDAVFGVNTNSILEDAQASLKSWGKNENAKTFTLTAPTLNRVSYASAIEKGTNIGQGIKDGINNWGNSLNIGLPTPFSGFDGLPSADDLAKDPSYQLDTGTYDPNDLVNGVGNIDDNTGKIKDSMELTEEDLKDLRSLAEMEWKKEFTTANIMVDMKNNNTINNQGDLDGWLGVLSDRLYEELGMVADGVYS